MTDEMKRWTVRKIDGPVKVTKYHTFRDCERMTSLESAVYYVDPDTLQGATPVNEVIDVDEQLCELLGLTECAQCETRRTGGPAVSTIAEFLQTFCNDNQVTLLEGSAVTTARNLVGALGVNGFYISRRGGPR